MAAFFTVAKKDEIAPGRGKAVEVKGVIIAVFNVDGAFHAMDNGCSHRGGPMADGPLRGCVATCPWHGWEFDVTNGACHSMPSAKQKTYETRLVGEDVQVAIPWINP